MGFSWLAEHNPDINWKMGEFKWRDADKRRFFKSLLMQRRLQRKEGNSPKPTIDEVPDEEEGKNKTRNVLIAKREEILEQMEEEWINAKTTTLNEFHLRYDKKKDDLPVEEQVPVEYHEFLDVFDEVKAD